MSRELLLILLFTLHWSGVSCCVWDNCAGEELPQLFTTLHPLFTLIFFWGCEIFSWIRLRSSAFNDDQLWSSMMTSFGLQWWPASVFDGDQLRSSIVAGLGMRWRVVKSGEEVSQLFTSQNPSVYRGFRRFGEEWRVKARVVFFLSSAIFFSLPPSLTFFRLLSSASSRRVVSCLAMARNCPGKGQYCAIARQYTLRASLHPPGPPWRPQSDVLAPRKYHHYLIIY